MRLFFADLPLLALALVSSAAQGQAQAGRASVDSAEVVREAEKVQRAFERVRLGNMPLGPSHGGSSHCDEFIGRFCYTYGDRSGKSEDPPPEKPEVGRARANVIRSLDSLSALLPQDEWITALLVHYRIEAGEPDAALGSLQRCRASRWWCDALRGYVLHSQGELQPAVDAFDRARAGMSLAERCKWEDASVLLYGESARVYSELPCEEKVSLAANMWWLADPLYSMPGNDRRSEHDARRVVERTVSRGVNPSGLRWDDDLSELVARFGWPHWWTRFWREMMNAGASHNQITQYHREPSYHFVPALAAVMQPARARESDWELLPERSSEEYSPLYASFGRLDHQTARFRRRDSLYVVASISLQQDSVLRGVRSLQPRVAFATGPGEVQWHDAAYAGSIFRMDVMLRDTVWIASVEAFAPEHERAARARFAVAPVRMDVHGHGISDLLLFDTRDSLPETLEEAAARMLAASATERTRRLGIYWEVYGVRPSDPIRVVLSAIPDERGVVRQIGEALGIVSRAGSIELRWPETTRPGDVFASRALALDLSGLARGWYTLELSVTVRDGQPLISRRRVQVLR